MVSLNFHLVRRDMHLKFVSQDTINIQCHERSVKKKIAEVAEYGHRMLSGSNTDVLDIRISRNKG